MEDMNNDLLENINTEALENLYDCIKELQEKGELIPPFRVGYLTNLEEKHNTK